MATKKTRKTTATPSHSMTSPTSHERNQSPARHKKRVIYSSVDVGSLTKMMTFLYGIIGLIGGIIYAVFFAASGLITGDPLMIFGAFAALIGVPLLYALFGAISGAIGAWLYNVFARKFGGVRGTIVEEMHE